MPQAYLCSSGDIPQGLVKSQELQIPRFSCFGIAFAFNENDIRSAPYQGEYS